MQAFYARRLLDFETFIPLAVTVDSEKAVEECFQEAFYDIFALIYRKKIFAFKTVIKRCFGLNAIGKHRVKENVRSSPFGRKILLPRFDMAKNNKNRNIRLDGINFGLW